MRKVFLIASFIAIFTACSSTDDGSKTGGDSFNRSTLLTHWADNIIIPSYQNYSNKVTAFSTAITDFTSNPTIENLVVARGSWVESYEAYQQVMLFNVGKASEIYFKETTNTYPTDVVGIEQNIASGSYNLELFSQFSKQGFPAFDYLLNGLANTDAEIVAFYTSNANAAAYKQYLLNLITVMNTKSNAVLLDWNGSYRATFIASNGTAVSSSTNKLTNLFVKNFEKDIRTGKIGIPAGVFSNGTLFPEKVEGFYMKNISKKLLNAAIQSQQDFFNGKSFSGTTTGPSLKSYLDDVNAVRNGQNLSDIINNQFTTIYAVNETLNANFSEQITSNNAKMIEAYDALQQNVIYFKLDMMQALNVTIDYVDGDGD
ncbi:imelysin family protein [Flavobacterium sp. SM2513]|uniref:imelysin family protein n=1 Tax=Flavobacterium sp. SM2513 TaxID=3424766 RepID=UPI003D7FDC88